MSEAICVYKAEMRTHPTDGEAAVPPVTETAPRPDGEAAVPPMSETVGTGRGRGLADRKKNRSRQGLKAKAYRIALLLVLLLVFISSAMEEEEMKETDNASAVKILFVGNSYTGQIKDMFRRVLRGTSHADSEATVVSEGGATLARLIKNGKALEWIKKQQWDYVVLQEQSVRPALAGRSEAAFHKAVDFLVGEIREIGAEPLLYMTWGRRDELNLRGGSPLDYATMQKNLSDAYRKAARRNAIRVVPVGEAWALARKRDADLGRRLYKKDGSHPSATGAFLVSCVFLRTLFDEPIGELAIPDDVDPQDGGVVQDVVTTMPQQTFDQ